MGLGGAGSPVGRRVWMGGMTSAVRCQVASAEIALHLDVVGEGDGSSSVRGGLVLSAQALEAVGPDGVEGLVVDDSE